ncbi:TPA: hypothetical protein ACGZ9C_003126 [Elizabethkingia anophelis]
MKTDKQLLELLIQYFEEKGVCEGLCTAAHEMERFDEIDYSEYKRLMSIIKENKPDQILEDGFYFKEFKKEPRIKFINNILENLK